jgi:hypothetical protein
LWNTTQKTETYQKQQAKVCGETKIAMALSPSQGGATSTLMNPMAYTIVVAIPPAIFPLVMG